LAGGDRLLEVSEDVIDVFDTNTESDHVGANANGV
jgi:hypothetical protein